MAGLHSVYLINVNQACPGHQSLFPTLFLEGQREECWRQKRQTRRTPGKRRGCTAQLARPWDLGCARRPGGGGWGKPAGEPSLTGWHGWSFRGRGRSQGLTRSGPQRPFLWPFGPDAEDWQKQRGTCALLAWKSLGKVCRVFTMSVGHDSAQRIW